MEAVFSLQNLAPDFHSSTVPRSSPLRWIHREIGTTDLYFVANPNPHSVVATCQFRVSGKTPELWHPDIGRVELAGIWHEQKGITHVELNLDAGGSVFVVFQHSSQGCDRDGRAEEPGVLTVNRVGDRSLTVSRSGVYSAKLASGRTLQTRVEQVPGPFDITWNWRLVMPAGPGASVHLSLARLASWTTQTNLAVKFFSGTASYETVFNLPPELLITNREFRLNLGDVKVIAEVLVNDMTFGVLWKAPFEADVTRAIKPGQNRLTVKVTNLWPNRLIGDESLPEDCTWDLPRRTDDGYPILAWPDWLQRSGSAPSGRTTFTTWKHWRKDSPLLDSGLLGPVTLQVLEHQPLQ
jgi:hypothetical protein